MSQSEQEVSQLLKKSLDFHGHSFHYAVMKKLEELGNAQTPWGNFLTEFPVQNKGQNSHIDFVLGSVDRNTFLIAECKRVDPAKGNWCFVKTPYFWKNDQFIQLDKIEGTTATGLTTSRTVMDVHPYNLGFEVKTDQKGDGIGSSDKSPINAAITQALRNTSGFINYCFEKLRWTNTNQQLIYRFIPVIFTTANLWVSDVDIGKSNLSDGKLPNDLVNAKKVDWIWFNQNRPDTLSPDLFLLGKQNYPVSYEYYKFLRSVAIVGSSGVESFLTKDYPSYLQNTDK